MPPMPGIWIPIKHNVGADGADDLDGVLSGTGLANHRKSIDRVQGGEQACSDNRVVIHDDHPHRFACGHDVAPARVTGSSACTWPPPPGRGPADGAAQVRGPFPHRGQSDTGPPWQVARAVVTDVHD